MPKLLYNLKIHEVSSVKRGAGEGVKVTLMKSDTSDANVLSIFKIALDHGATLQEVARAEVAMNKAADEIEQNIDASAQQASVETSLSQCIDHLAGLVPAGKVDAFKTAVAAVTKESDMTEAEKAEALKKEQDLAKTLEALQKSNAALTRQVAILSMSKEEQDYIVAAPLEGEKLDTFIAAKPEERAETIKAFPPKKKPNGKNVDEDDTAKSIEKAIAESPVLKALQTENAELKKKDKLARFAKEAVAMGLPEAHGEVMMKAFEGDEEAIKKHSAMVKGIAEQARTGKIFEEFGKGGDNQPGATAYDQIRAKGEELRKADPKLSPQQARAKVLSDPANADLVQRNKAEEAARRRAA